MSTSVGKNVTLEKPDDFGKLLQDEGIIFTQLDKAVNWARKSSIWPLGFGLACCAIEMMSMAAARFDVARFGSEVFRPSPRQADLMIIAGRVSQKMAPVIKQLHAQMPEPKWVISMGACATSGGVFNNYAIVQGVNQVIPVDIYVPGMPAAPRGPALRHPATPGKNHQRTRQLQARPEHRVSGLVGKLSPAILRAVAVRIGVTLCVDNPVFKSPTEDPAIRSGVATEPKI